MADEYEIHKNKRPDKTYISKSLAFKSQANRRFRIASKVFDSSETHEFALEHGEHVIRVTDGGRQEVVAKFYEDNRGVFVLTLQRFTTNTGTPHQTYFSFVGEEIQQLLRFISNLKAVQFSNHERVNVSDQELEKLLLTPDQIREVIVQNQDVVLQLARSEITTSDIVALGYRRKELGLYETLLYDAEYFKHIQPEFPFWSSGRDQSSRSTTALQRFSAVFTCDPRCGGGAGVEPGPVVENWPRKRRSADTAPTLPLGNSPL